MKKTKKAIFFIVIFILVSGILLLILQGKEKECVVDEFKQQENRWKNAECLAHCPSGLNFKCYGLKFYKNEKILFESDKCIVKEKDYFCMGLLLR